MGETMEGWPLAGSRPLAWSPPGASLALASVPLMPEHLTGPMKLRDYRSLLTSRVMWMAERTPSPEGAVRAMVRQMADRGLWALGVPEGDPAEQVRQLLAGNPAWPDYLNLAIPLPEPPFRPRMMPAAVQAVKATTLEEWIGLAFLPMDDLT